jgi:tRNA (guanine37-N1)-methyltransferase
MTHAPACRVSEKDAERVRRLLQSKGVLSRELEPRREGGKVIFPLLRAIQDETLELTDGDFEERPHRILSYMELAKVPAELKDELPRAFDIVGDIVLVRLPKNLVTYKREIGEALLSFVSGARVVAVDSGVKGESRLRALEIVAGEGPLATIHKENGLSFKVDLERAYFSPRLSGEHEHVSAASHDGERLLDLFCGIGPFSLTVLDRFPKSTAVGVDSNIGAIELMRENAERFGVANRLECRMEDAEVFLGGKDEFDRVVMNLPREGYKYLSLVGRHVKSPGWLHFYGLVPKEEIDSKGLEVLHALSAEGRAGKWSVREARVVHPYSPFTSLVGYSLEKHASR